MDSTVSEWHAVSKCTQQNGQKEHWIRTMCLLKEKQWIGGLRHSIHLILAVMEPPPKSDSVIFHSCSGCTPPETERNVAAASLLCLAFSQPFLLGPLCISINSQRDSAGGPIISPCTSFSWSPTCTTQSGCHTAVLSPPWTDETLKKDSFVMCLHLLMPLCAPPSTNRTESGDEGGNNLSPQEGSKQ